MPFQFGAPYLCIQVINKLIPGSNPEMEYLQSFKEKESGHYKNFFFEMMLHIVTGHLEVTCQGVLTKHSQFHLCTESTNGSFQVYHAALKSSVYYLARHYHPIYVYRFLMCTFSCLSINFILLVLTVMLQI